jgi:hypothetical protein
VNIYLYWYKKNSDQSYEECDVSLICYVLDCHLGEQRVLVVDEDQFVVGDYVDVVGAHIEGGLEQVGHREVVLLVTAVVVVAV